MSTIKSSDEHLTLNADGSGKDIKFQANGVEKASISSAGAFTSTTIDATKLTGTIPNFTSTGIDDNADATAMTIDSNEHIGIGVAPKIITGGSRYLTVGTQTAGQAGFLELVGNRTANAGQDTAIMKFINNTTEIAEIGAYDNGSTNGGDLKFSTTVGGTPNVRLTIKGDGRGLSQFTAKAWMRFDQYYSNNLRDSHNVSSVTDHGTGEFTMNFSNNMAQDKYCVQTTGHYGGSADDMGTLLWRSSADLTTSSARFYFMAYLNSGSTGPALYDVEEAMVLIFGD